MEKKRNMKEIQKKKSDLEQEIQNVKKKKKTCQ